MKKGIIAVILLAGLCILAGCGGGPTVEPPTADFSVDKADVVVGQTITFTDHSTGDPTSWSWDFGDGESSTAQNPTHSYDAVGIYTVSLTVTNAGGSDTETRENYIEVSQLVEKPIEDITDALAAREGVGVEDIEIAFCEPATVEGDLFAVGAIVDATKSIVFIYDTATEEITVEAEYVATTADEISALSTASKQNSKWTGNLIVPLDFEEDGGVYSFKYYDGYYSILSRWSYGWGTVDIDTLDVEWGQHI